MLPDTCYLILFTCCWLPDTFHLELVTGYLLPKTCYIIVLVTLHLLTHIYRSASSSIDPVHLGTPAIYSSFKKCPQNCHRLQFIPHFFSWIKTANGGSSMDICQNCKPWQFYGHFSEFMCIVSIQLQTLAVLWTLFGHFVAP